MSKTLMALAAVGAACLFGSSAQAQALTVLGGGMARECSFAALAGESDTRFETTCTLALNTENLTSLDRAGTLVNRGVIKLRRKAYASAQADFNSALDVKPDLGEAYANRGAAAVGSRKFAEGIADLGKAIELGVQEPEKVYYNRALAYEKLGQSREAYFDYIKAIELKPTWEQPRIELARFTVEKP